MNGQPSLTLTGIMVTTTTMLN